MSEPRKASEILLSLEDRIISIESKINLYNTTQLLILQKVNEIFASLSSDTQNIEDNKPIQITSGQSIDVETNFKGERRVNRNQPISTKASNSDITFKDYIAQRAAEKNAPLNDLKITNSETEVVKINKPIVVEKKQQERKIPITQRVQDENKKDWFNADVNIFSDNGNSVYRGKTNALGKWQAQLSPGKYSVKVTKMNMSTQNKLENEQTIVVPNTDTTVTLNTLIIDRK